jgi:cytoskeletal protein CcmA (bactofilin family)
MSSRSQPLGPGAPVRAAEAPAQRPLPASVVGLSGPERGAARPAQRGAAPSGTLIVGRGIQVKGEIESCRTLVVEGQVAASLDADALEVLEDGLFQGTAEVERAEITGRFEGRLIARKQLTIKAGGRAAGTIRYARVTIEPGGEIAGDVDSGTEIEAEKGPKALSATGS